MTDRPWLRHYDYWVPQHLTYPERPLHEILDSTVVDVPDRPATSFLGATLTFAEIKERSDRLASALGDLTIAKGDRVGILLPNCPQYIIAAFAILRHGAIVVNINPTYTAREVLALTGDSGVRFVVTLDVLAPLFSHGSESSSIERVIVTSMGEYSPAATPASAAGGAVTLAALLASVVEPEIVRAPIAAGDIAVLQYTGGTTGAPKGAMLTHGNIF